MTAHARFLLAALVLTLAACTPKPPPAVDPNLFPKDYREEILKTLKNTLAVNTNVRDAFISPPVLTPVGKDQRYTACVRANSRNMEGEYTGPKDRIAYFYGGHLNQLVLAEPGQCANAAYAPFPALEHICLTKKCQ